MYERCPNGCNEYFSCELDTENNAIVYECTVCGWQEMEHNPFYISPWVVSINQAVASIDIVQSLLVNEDVVKFLRPRLQGESFLSNRDDYHSDEYLHGEVDTAHQTYLR